MRDNKKKGKKRKKEIHSKKKKKQTPASCQDFYFQAGLLALLASKPHSTGCGTARSYLAACAAFNATGEETCAFGQHEPPPGAQPQGGDGRILCRAASSAVPHPPPCRTGARGKAELGLAPALNQTLRQMAKVMPDLSVQLQMPVLMASGQKDNKQRYFFLACHPPETLCNKRVLGWKKLAAPLRWEGHRPTVIIH